MQQVFPFTMPDLRNPKLIWLKGWLFLGGGILSSLAILIEVPQGRIALLLAIAIWCFARCYYFAFYVIQHYVDPQYRFAGLLDFARYALSRRRRSVAPPVCAEHELE